MSFDLILVGYLCDIQKFGIYSIARSLSTVLFTTVNGPLGVILFPILSKVIKNENGISEFFLSISKRIYAVNLSIIICVLILSKDFLRLIIIAFFIAAPVAWLLMNKWLQDFAYRTAISWWVFAVAVLSALVVTCIAVGFQTIRAAVANPVKSLRTE